MAIFALIGAVVSSNVPDGALLAVFATMALIASGLFGLQALRMTMRPKQPHSARLWRLHLEPSWGFLVFWTDKAGSFILIPLRVYVLRVPTRFTIGSNLGIILFAVLAGLEGNLVRLRFRYF